MIDGFSIIEKEITNLIRERLDKIGIHYRIFSRIKDRVSITEKCIRKEKEGAPYCMGGKLIQDLIGIRIITYFKEDLDIVYKILKPLLNYYDEEIDDLEIAVFKPKRNNIICKFNAEHTEFFEDVQKTSVNESYNLVDNTFELQLRTILSEGWHEIDHSLRYKCKEDWMGHQENERMLNGIYATLETNDTAMASLFNELAYKHYKNGNWEGLIRTKFRLKLQLTPFDIRINEILNDNKDIGKQILRLDRTKLIYKISSMEVSIPITLNNLVFLANIFFLNNPNILRIIPKHIVDSQ